jgi:hypothetical protein
MEDAIDLDACAAVLGDRDDGVARTIEKLGDSCEFLSDPGAQGFANVHLPAGHLYAHARLPSAAPGPSGPARRSPGRLAPEQASVNEVGYQVVRRQVSGVGRQAPGFGALFPDVLLKSQPNWGVCMVWRIPARYLIAAAWRLAPLTPDT